LAGFQYGLIIIQQLLTFTEPLKLYQRHAGSHISRG